jgi:hypothetical protein
MAFEFEYVTGTVSVLLNDGIVIHAVNDSAAQAQTEAIIYRNTGAGAVVAGQATNPVEPSATWALGFPVAQSGEYWVRVRASSQEVIPKVSFERLRDGVWYPVVSYRPADFALFRLRPSRKRMW